MGAAESSQFTEYAEEVKAFVKHAEKGDEDALFEVLYKESGSCLNAQRDFDGFNALMAAITNGHFDLAHRLLDVEGIDPRKKDKRGMTALIRAVKKNNVPLVQKIFGMTNKLADQDSDGWTVVHHAAFHGHADLLQELVDLDAPLDMKDRAGQTALHIAVHEEHSDCIRVLLDGGASTKIEDAEEMTALQLCEGAEKETEMMATFHLFAQERNNAAGPMASLLGGLNAV